MSIILKHVMVDVFRISEDRRKSKNKDALNCLRSGDEDSEVSEEVEENHVTLGGVTDRAGAS